VNDEEFYTYLHLKFAKKEVVLSLFIPLNTSVFYSFIYLTGQTLSHIPNPRKLFFLLLLVFSTFPFYPKSDICYLTSYINLTSPTLSAGETIPDSYILIDFDDGRICEIKDSLGFLEHPFPIGSTVKIFSTLAYLKEGGDKKKVLLCPETKSGSPIPPTCWYRPGHGYLDLKGAIANSCDTYFSKIFSLKRYDIFLTILQEYNLLTNNDYKTFCGLSNAEKRKVWIGLGKNLLIKPLDLFLAIYSVVGNENLYVRNDSILIFERKINNNDKYIKVIKEGMREGSLTGTTKIAQEMLGMKKVFGKTGTATYFLEKEDHKKTHGYFICFHPYPNPQWGILVFILEGDGKTSAKLGASILKDFLENKETVIR
jgi:hypothetical protein